jgi:hypothetical protein
MWAVSWNPPGHFVSRRSAVTRAYYTAFTEENQS